MENYKNPSNRGLVDDDTYKQIHMDYESCIDDIYVQIKIKDEIIEDIRFDGEACTISTATASIMTKLFMGKAVEEVKIIIDNYNNMVQQKKYDSDLLEEANVFKNIHSQPSRVPCALLPWEAAEKLLKEVI